MEKEPKHWSEHPAYKQQDLNIRNDEELQAAQVIMDANKDYNEDIKISNEQELEKAKEITGVSRSHEEIMKRFEDFEKEVSSKMICYDEKDFLDRVAKIQEKADRWKVEEYGNTKILLATSFSHYPSGNIVERSKMLSAQALFSPDRIVPFYFHHKMKDYMNKNFPENQYDFKGFLNLGLDKDRNIRAYATEGWGSY